MKEYIDEQTEYNMHEGLSIQLHNYILKKLGVSVNEMSTDLSNELLEIIDECMSEMYDQLTARVEDEIEERLNKND